VRRNIVVRRTAMKLAVAVIAAGLGLAVSACGTVKLGAAAITGSNRITSATLTDEVGNLNAAYKADTAKGIKPQRPVGQETQQVLSWLVLFPVYDKLAEQHGIKVTQADIERAHNTYANQASASHLTLAEYLSAGAALPPNLVEEFSRAAAIASALQTQIDGGTTPSTAAGQAAVSAKFSRYQCIAAKDLGVKVNPQFGQFDYSGFVVVPAPPTLAAAPSPKASPSPVQTTPPC